METDLNTYLNGTALNRTIAGNLTNTTFDFQLAPIEVVGMDGVIIFMTIQTIILIFILWLQIRQVVRYGK